ncbi:MAG: hypothetical protein FJ253_07925 [Phycisphaerae bacterium]|nr:hypothetical protein [Phycisphaerae bacterium]
MRSHHRAAGSFHSPRGTKVPLAALVAGAAAALPALESIADGPPPAPPASQMRAEALRNAAKPASPFTLQVEQMVPLDPPGWDLLEMQRLEVAQVNATSEQARNEIAVEIEALRKRLDDGACVLLGRGPIASGGRGAGGTAVLVPAGLGGRAALRGESVRVVPSAIPWPSMAVGDARRSYPELRLYGTPARPGFVAESIEVLPPPGEKESAKRAPAAPSPTTWGRASAISLPESSQLVCDAPVPGAATSRWIPMSVTVRNSGAKPLPECEVFVEFLDSSGQLLHREFKWITERDSTASEARLPALAPGASTVIRVPAPPSIADKATECRVLIVRLLTDSKR